MSRFVIGDIHGMYDKMVKALDFAGFYPSKDVLFGVGDFCDRGPDSLKVLEYLMNLGDGFKSAFGNHDFWLWQFLQLDIKYTKAENVNPNLLGNLVYYDVTDDGSLVSWTKETMGEDIIDCWMHNGGERTISSLSKASSEELSEIFNWLNKMPYRIELEDYFIQHTFCGLQNSFFPDKNYSINMKALTEQGRIDLGYDNNFWDRKFLSFSKELCGPDAYPLSEKIRNSIPEKTMIIGHTPIVGYNMEPVPVYDKDLNFILMDSGGFVSKSKYNVPKDGELSVLNLDSHIWFTSGGESGEFK